jgi:hypothetical protein
MYLRFISGSQIRGFAPGVAGLRAPLGTNAPRAVRDRRVLGVETSKAMYLSSEMKERARAWNITTPATCPHFRVQGSGYRVQGTGFRVQGTGFRVQGPGSKSQLAPHQVNTTGRDTLRHQYKVGCFEGV